MNSHGIADFAHELQAVCADQLPACVIAGGAPTVPVPPSLVLPAFATEAYVREAETLVYVNQDAHTVTLTGADGNYWLAVSVDNWTSYAQWTTEPGTAYRWRPNATQPADVAGLLTFASVTVAGGAVSAVTPLPTVTRAAAGRTLLELGTLAEQDAGAVAITGGEVAGLTSAASRIFRVNDTGLTDQIAFYTDLPASGGSALYFAGTAPCLFGGTVQVVGVLGVQSAPSGNTGLTLKHAKAAQYGMVLQPTDTDTGNPAIQFLNLASGSVGAITTTATTTTYGTTSDGRLKEGLAPLRGALETLTQLLPVRFRWKADGSPGVGFVAQAVQPVVPEAVTGTPEGPAPMSMDLSKLVPYLVSALQDLSQRLEALEAVRGADDATSA